MIAIIGMACQYPDANSPIELWENTLCKRKSFRKIPSQRLDLYGYDKIFGVDSIYVKEAALIEGYEFDRNKYKISGTTFRSTDLTHWLALDVANRALNDAGLPEGKGLDRQNTAVIVGNTLAGEFSRASLMRLRWPYVKKTIKKQLLLEGWEENNTNKFLESLEIEYKLPFEPPNEDSLAGGLANTIAGRICNYFNFNGGGYTVDGACSSSLLAVHNACSMIEAGDAQSVLVGGVDISIDPFELIGFSRIGAMAHEEMRVYDKNPTGFLPGEGCGFIVLMNYEEAISKGLRPYATIKGWGISSDGGGGITRPEKNGQKLAIKRAYNKAKYNINTVALFEGHGTGTLVGDEVELSALSELITDSKNIPVIGSIKPNIGHTKAAAGMAGVIKSVMSINNQIIPPITNTKNPNAIFNLGKLRLAKEAEVWPKDSSLRVGVSSFGFGGINVHITIEGTNLNFKRKLTEHESKISKTEQSSELFILSGKDFDELKNKIEELIVQSTNISYSEMTDLSFYLIEENKNEKIRAAIVANNPEDLFLKLNELLKVIKSGKTLFFDNSGIFLNDKKQKLGLMFPGQASTVRFNAGSLDKFSKVNEIYNKYCVNFNDKLNTSHAQPCIVLSEISGLVLLEELGVKADIAIGHSLGELVALYWGGSIDQDSLIDLAKERGKIMNDESIEGCMAAVSGEISLIQKIAQESDVDISAYNKKQVVVSGSPHNIQIFIEKAELKNLNTIKLPVRKPFHSRLMKNSAGKLENYLTNFDIKPCDKKVVSTITGNLIENNIKENLVKQLVEPVMFSQAFDNFSNECDYLIEIGPGDVLTKLSGHDKVLTLDCCSESIDGLLKGVGAIYAFGGQDLNFDLLKNRFYKKYKLIKSFFSNQCETFQKLDLIETLPEKEEIKKETNQSTIDIFKEILSKKVELNISDIKENQNLLKDLHMNSISVGQAVAELSKMLNLKSQISPMEFANSTVGEVCSLLESKLKNNIDVDQKENLVKGINSWIKCFNIELEKCDVNKQILKDLGGVPDWKLFSNNNKLAKEVFNSIRNQNIKGALICLDGNPEDDVNLEMLLEFSKYCIKNKVEKIVLLQHNGFASSFIRSLNEETNADIVIVDTPYENKFIVNIVQECYSDKKIIDCIYDDKNRYEKVLKLIENKEEDENILQNSTVLVTGGGKGITFECIYALSNKYKNKLIIIGRSDPDKDEKLKNNLKRLESSNIKFKYLSVDLNDKLILQETIELAQKEFGEISCVIHGAGVNHPCLAEDLSIDKAYRVLNPKVFGLKNILEILKNKIKLLINFSSIIGRVGMIGECDYAYANSWISWLANEYNKKDNCKCISLEWSVWSGVGMGEQLGKIDELLEKGITPITPEQGVKCFMNLLDNKNIKSNIFISGRLGKKPPIDICPKKELPFNRFLENIKVFYPNVELICEAQLSINDDLYLKDHIYKGEYIFPVVLGIEAIIQISQAITGKQSLPTIKDLKLNRPIVVGEKDLTIRILSFLNENKEVEVAIRCNQTNFQVDHFTAIVSFEEVKSKLNIIRRKNKDILLDESFYGKLFFQSGKFKCIKNYNNISELFCSANLLNQNSNWYSPFLPQKLIVGNPGVRDAAIHALQSCIPGRVVLPVSLESWTILETIDSGDCVVNAEQVWEKDNEYCFNLEISNNNSIKEIWKGLVLKEIDKLNWDEININLLSTHINRESKKILKNKDFNVSIINYDKKEELIEDCLNEHAKITYRSDGKPTTNSGFISFSDCGDLRMAIGSEKYEVGCDIELVEERSMEIWKRLLGENFSLINHLPENKESLSESCTQIWCAMECMKKTDINSSESLIFKQKENNSLVLGSNNFSVYSTILNIKGFGKHCVSVLVKNESL